MKLEVTRKIRDRFEWKIEVDEYTRCWLWTGAKDSKGYGKFSIEQKYCGAHRASWLIYNGEIPDGMLVCHHCDTPACVNPVHLWIGTQSENLKDSVRKGRHSSLRLNGSTGETYDV